MNRVRNRLLVDLKNDFYEERNLIGDPELREVVSKLAGVAATFPEKDADPDYTRRAPNKWDWKVRGKSQEHKPAQPTSNPPEIVVPGSQHENDWLKNDKEKKQPVNVAPAVPSATGARWPRA